MRNVKPFERKYESFIFNLSHMTSTVLAFSKHVTITLNHF